MKHGEKVALCLVGGLALYPGAQAVTTDTSANPYLGIVDRNVFALKPAPPPPPPPGPPEAPPQKIVLTGIVNAFNKKQVFFKTPMSAKPGEAPKETSFMLSEGERAGEIEVLEINEKAGTIRVKNHNLEQSLSLKNDGMKPTGAAGGGAAGLPAVPGLGVPGVGVPGMGAGRGGVAAPSLTPVPTLGGSGAASIQRPLRATPQPGLGVPQGYGAPAVSAPSGAKLPDPQQAMTPEEQIVLMEINRVRTKEAVARGDMPPLPETPFTPKPAPQ